MSVISRPNITYKNDANTWLLPSSIEPATLRAQGAQNARYQRMIEFWHPTGPDDFPRLVAGIASGDLSQDPSRATRALWAIRWKVGELLGWDGPDTGIDSRVPTLRDRLPADLRAAPSGPDFAALPFTSLYLLENEFAAEIANRTMHGVLHLGWVPDQTGGYRGQMAVLVKPNGLLGSGYMAAIKPLRHLIVYPQMMQQIERAWNARIAQDRGEPARSRH
jgi:Protein of unknown function (DUF2867)